MMKTLNMMFLLIMVMISIAFFTLIERKIIGYMQSRKGPNKTMIMGMTQPINDAIKLISKEMNMNLKSNKMAFLMSPTLNISTSFFIWMTIPMMWTFNFMKMGMLMMMSCMALNTLTIMMMSWSSNSSYSFIGMIRTISQMVSYEINFIMIMLIIMNLHEQMNFNMLGENQKFMPTAITSIPLVIVWAITILAETNRTPFDFSEGESELISGFNIEYSSTSFMMLFLAEYSSILFMSFITPLMFSNLAPNEPMFYLVYTVSLNSFIWARSTLPRFRYDKLMKLNWTQILPITTYMLMASFSMKMY